MLGSLGILGSYGPGVRETSLYLLSLAHVLRPISGTVKVGHGELDAPTAIHVVELVWGEDLVVAIVVLGQVTMGPKSDVVARL